MNETILPIGIEDFTELRTEGYYYIDKTGFIKEILQKRFKVNLITRPRRFGKTLMMNTLADFLDIRKDSKEIFEGLRIAQEQELCEAWQNKWPVLSLTLKNVEGLDYQNAYGLLVRQIADICKDHAYLADSNRVDDDDRNIFMHLKAGSGDSLELKGALATLVRMMQAHYGRQVILLIDEYDVPLAKASENNYYVSMLDMLRSMLGIVLKSNRFLKFAVITGCLRIAKESIFTGTNNFVSSSIMDNRYQSFFGFTETEVQKLLEDTGLAAYAEQIRKWYNGYCFGSADIYCPWDVLNYVNELQENKAATPKNYWKNTSHNSIIRSFIDRSDLFVNEKFEKLLEGESIHEKICDDLTYDLLYSSEENLWSVLYLTGYLTKEKTAENTDDAGINLKIPNEEVKAIFRETVAEWFRDSISTMDRSELFKAYWQGDDVRASELTSDILFTSISYHDYREDYYHAFVEGLFLGAGYQVESNHEHGLGRPDIVVMDKKKRTVLILEFKYSSSPEAMEQDCRKALQQIDTREYAKDFQKEYRKVTCYGVAFYKKQCIIKRQT